MKIPTPMNDNARDDRFNRGLERLLQGDSTGIDEIEPELQETAIEMVKLANDADWIGSDPGEEKIHSRPWRRNTRQVTNAVAAVLAVGLITMMVTFGLRVMDESGGQFGSDSNDILLTEMGPGVCAREPRSDAEIADIVRKSQAEVEPFQSDGVTAELTGAALQLTRDWNACLQEESWKKAMAYESEHLIWSLGQEEFPNGTDGISNVEIANRLTERQAGITPIDTDDGMNLSVYSAENYKYVPHDGPPLNLGADYWVVPMTEERHWVEWPTVVTVEWDGQQFVIVSATRDGVPESPYLRDDTLPESTPDTPSP